MEHFVTIFDKNYIPQGLSLYNSLEDNLDSFKLWIICLDDESKLIIENLNKKNIETISIKNLENETLRNIKKTRHQSEYCWTLTPFAPKFIFDRDKKVNRVTYLDADMFFFKSPKSIFEEFEKSKKSVLITEHDYDLDKKNKELESGKYIVQFMIFIRDKSEVVRQWWEEKCIERCSEVVKDGKIGDQGYLNDWETRFSEYVHVLINNDVFRSTWNFNKLKFDHLIAWHFHGLKIINNNLVQQHSSKYLPKDIILKIYLPYLKILNKNIKLLNFEVSQRSKSNNKFYNLLSKIQLFLISKNIIKNNRYVILNKTK